MKNFELISFPNAEELARVVAGAWLNEVEAATRSGKDYHVAISGGRIAQTLFKCLVQQVKTSGSSLQKVHFFWADERCVPPTDPESNYRIARDLLFVPLNIPESHIHRIHGEDSPERAARAAEEDIRRMVPLNAAGQPMLDFIFLGLGEDGHTASLFPNEPEAVSADPAVYRAVFNSPKPPPIRITLGFPAIAAARQVWMLASGGGKQSAMQRSLEPGVKTPFARVLHLRSQTKIFTDIH
jgi:6-phosphogluconolactonase